MSASIKKKSKPKSDKVATNNNKQQQTTNNKRPFFLPKINKVFLRPILQNLKGRSVLDKFFFENDPLDEPNQMPPSKKFYLLSKLVKNAKWWSKSSLPLSHSTAKFFPLKKGFKKSLVTWPQHIYYGSHRWKSKFQHFAKIPEFQKSEKKICINFYCSKNLGHFSL